MAGLLSPSGAPGLLSRSRTDVVLKCLGSCTPSFSPSLPPPRAGPAGLQEEAKETCKCGARQAMLLGRTSLRN